MKRLGRANGFARQAAILRHDAASPATSPKSMSVRRSRRASRIAAIGQTSLSTPDGSSHHALVSFSPPDGKMVLAAAARGRALSSGAPRRAAITAFFCRPFCPPGLDRESLPRRTGAEAGKGGAFINSPLKRLDPDPVCSRGRPTRRQSGTRAVSSNPPPRRAGVNSLCASAGQFQISNLKSFGRAA